MILAAVTEAHAAGARLAALGRIIGISTRTLQRWQARPDGDDQRCGPHHEPPNALTAAERAVILTLLTSPSHSGLSPKQLVPRLADAGRYLASESTLYRLRRRIAGANRPAASRTHVTRATHTHRATGPNQLWSWDISYLPTPVRGADLYLYLVVDVWRRRIVGGDVHDRETAAHAATLIQRICEDTGIDPRGLVLHADNGTPMRGSTMLATLQWLGIVPSFSRPHVSNDNPYSKALFRTLKYTPAYPRVPFAHRDAARSWVQRFVDWYNGEHRHSAIRYVTPNQRHAGDDGRVLARRQALYQKARAATPQRWSGATRNWSPVGSVVLNPQPLPLETKAV